MTNTRYLFLIGLAAIGLAVPVSTADAQTGAKNHSKVDSALREALNTGAATQRVIITLTPGHRADMRKRLEAHGDAVRSELSSVEALVADIHSADVDELAARDDVAALSLDSDIYADGAAPQKKNSFTDAITASSSSLGTSTLRETLGLPKVANSSTLTGSTGIGVAIIDSGIAPSLNFNGRITGFYDYVKGNGKSAAPYDDFGHGTHIAGLIGSSGVLSNYEYQGIAPDVHLVGLKVLDKAGQGQDERRHQSARVRRRQQDRN